MDMSQHPRLSEDDIPQEEFAMRWTIHEEQGQLGRDLTAIWSRAQAVICAAITTEAEIIIEQMNVTAIGRALRDQVELAHPSFTANLASAITRMFNDIFTGQHDPGHQVRARHPRRRFQPSA